VPLSRWVLLFLLAGAGFAQRPAEVHRPGLFLREDFKETPEATPITQDHVANPDLRLGLYGPGKAGIKKSHHDTPADDPYYVWSGTSDGNWGVTLRHRSSNVDLTGFAKIRWRSEQAGFRQLHIILKLADGTWLVSDAADGPSKDWRIGEFNVSDIRWRRLDIAKVIEQRWVEHPNLANVEEVGWTDLMPGGGSDACSRVDWIEVYGNAVKR